MRQRQTIPCLLIGCLLMLSACAQQASVGIPTPDQSVAATAAAQAAIAAAATASAAAPVETPVPPPQATETPVPQPPAATETPAAPPPTAEPPTPVPPTAAPAANAATVGCNQQIVYIVKPGDNLFRIALRYNTTIYAIARRNGITNVRVIHTGQRLRIVTCARGSSPSTAPRARGGTYVVRPGDNLFRIALRYGTTVHRIMVANGRYTSIIVPGQVLVIP
jgi:LysM repeat protein